jgi:hypothetical protein
VEAIQPWNLNREYNEFYSTGLWMPCNKEVRDAHSNYKADTYSKKCRSEKSSDYQDEEEEVCVKFIRGQHSSLSPGVMLVFCVPHDTLLGFYILKDSESPRSVMDVVRRRWKHAPHIILYDNACNASVFCDRREREYFQHVLWVIDKFHFPNHCNCARCFCVNSYPFLAPFNSQLTEQCNARLARLRKSLSYMNKVHYLYMLRLFLFVVEAYRKITRARRTWTL